MSSTVAGPVTPDPAPVTRRRWVLALPLLLLVVAGLFPLATAGRRAASTSWRPRLVIMVVLDTCRADHLGCYGYARDTSPNLDKVAREGILFENAFSQSNASLYSSASIMTGRYPQRFAPLEYQDFHLPAQAVTLASTLRSFGHRTAGFVAGGHWSSGFGLDNGFESYDDSVSFGSFHHTLPPAMTWLDGLGKESLGFMLLHGYDAHVPTVKPMVFQDMFDPAYHGIADKIIGLPDGLENIYRGEYFVSRPALKSLDERVRGQVFLSTDHYRALEDLSRTDAPRIKLSDADVRHIVAHYDGSLRYADVHLGLLMARINALGLRNDTLLVVLGDHGEQLMEDGFFGHQSMVRDGELHVPLVLWGPGGLPGGRRIADVVELVDVMPTVLDYAASADGVEGDGRSLRPLIEGTVGAWTAAAFAEGACPLLTVRTAEARLVCKRSPRAPLPKLTAEDYRFFAIRGGEEVESPPAGALAEALLMRLAGWVKRVRGQ